MPKQVCIISEFYPTENEPLFPFVQQLAFSLSKEGVTCTVIAPQSLSKRIIRRMRPKPFFEIDISPDGLPIRVLRPYILTFSNTNNHFLQWIADKIMEHAIKRGVKNAGKVDAIYCYFWHVGLMTVIALKDYDVPLFIQASECELTIHPYMIKRKYLDRVREVICASEKNKQESIDAGLIGVDKTHVVVNGYRQDEFYHIDTNTARAEFKISSDKFIVVFLGGFIERKGIIQLSNVLDRFDDVYSIFLGQGANPPKCKNVLFCDKCDHHNVVKYLNCGDIFVLPTRAEGCCNAIIEALACGLPVISSNKSFNDEILSSECSIRINEQDEDELYQAILKLKNDCALRKQMSIAAMKKAESLTIEHRAKAIKKILFPDQGV